MSEPTKLEPWEKSWVNVVIVKPLQKLDLDELRQRARDKGMEVDGRWSRKTLIKKITAVNVEFYRRAFGR